MTSAQKTLRVLCIITIVMCAIFLVGGILTVALGGFIGLNAAEFADATVTTSQASAAGALISIAAAIVMIPLIFELIMGILGLRGAKDPSKIGPFYVLCIICTALDAGSVIYVLTQGSDATTVVSNIIGLALAIWCLWLASKIKKQDNVLPQ